MTKTASTSGYELGLLAAAGVLTIVPGAFVIYFVRNYIAKGFALGPRVRRPAQWTAHRSFMDGLDLADGAVLRLHFLCLIAHVVWEYYVPGGTPRRGIFGLDTTRGDRLFITLLGSCLHFSRLARHHGHTALGRPHHLADLGLHRVPLGVTDYPLDPPRGGTYIVTLRCYRRRCHEQCGKARSGRHADWPCPFEGCRSRSRARRFIAACLASS